jgi:hypothetical protein
MIKKTLITEEEEIQLLANVLTEECPISKRMLDIHYEKEMIEPNENKEAPEPQQKYR